MKKLNVNRYDTDKSEAYHQNYAEHFESILDKEVRLLELGVAHGSSLFLLHLKYERPRGNLNQ